jgi:nucleotide-binding universal stress UspA family protein
LSKIGSQRKREQPVNVKEQQQFGSPVNPSKTLHVQIGLPRFERMLVAYDGMPISKKALRYAVYISNISGSEIIVVKVVEGNRDLINALPITIKANLHAKEEQGEITKSHKLLQEVIDEMKTACISAGMTRKIIFEIREGNPANEIIKLSNLMHFDLIVMGSRKISSRIGGIGSTTRRVISASKIPVLVVQKQPRYKDEW